MPSQKTGSRTKYNLADSALDTSRELPKIDVVATSDLPEFSKTNQRLRNIRTSQASKPTFLAPCQTKYCLRLTLSRSIGTISDKDVRNAGTDHLIAPGNAMLQLTSRSEPSPPSKYFLAPVLGALGVKAPSKQKLDLWDENIPLDINKGGYPRDVEQQASSASTTEFGKSQRNSPSEPPTQLNRSKTHIPKTEWLEWDNPFRDLRKSLSSRSAVVEGSEDGKPSKKKLQGLQDIDGSSLQSKNTNVARKEKSDISPMQADIDSTEKKMQRRSKVLPVASRGASRLPLQKQLNWNAPTVAEGRASSFVEVGATTLIDRRAKLFEDYCGCHILDPTIKAIQWGNLESPSSRGGLSDLKEFTIESNLKTPKYLSTISKGMQLCKELETANSKKLIRQGVTHATLTKLMAEEYIRAFGNEEEPQSVEQYFDLDMKTSDPLDRNHIDQSLADRFVSMRKAEQRSDEAGLIGNSLRTGVNTQSTAGKLLTELAKDASFEIDIKFMKMKELDLNSPDGMAGENRTYYVRFSVLEAVGLPKMDDTKESYCDTYVRCSIQSRSKGKLGDVLSGQKGLYRRATSVAWNSKDPVWKQDFEFAFTSDIHNEITLVFDLHDVNIGQQGNDHFIGYVQFTLFQDGKRCMPLEHEIEDTYQIMRQSAMRSPSARSAEDERVRCNNGIVGADKLGRPSTLRLRIFFSSKPKIQPQCCAELLQSNIRCMLARKKVARIRKTNFAFLDLKESSLIEYELHAGSIWKDYCDICVEESTLPVRNLKKQVNSRRIALQRYPLTSNGCIALSSLLRIMIDRNRLQSLILTDLGLRSQGIIALVSALTEASNLEALILDRNPISFESTQGHTGSNEHQTESLVHRAIKAIATLIRLSESLTLISLEETHICGAEISIIAAASAQSGSLQILNLKYNPQDFKSQTSQPAKAVGELLKDSTLIDLNYSCNPMNAEAAFDLVQGCSLSFLSRLHLHRTGICKNEKVNRCLAAYIKNTKCCLDLLDLSYCEMDESGAMILSDAVNCNESLQVVILDGNRFGENGYFAFMSHEGKSKVMIEPATETADRDDSHAVKMLIPISQLLIDYGDFRHKTSEEFDPKRLTRFTERMQIDMDFAEIEHTCIEAKEKRGFLKDFNSFYQWYIEAVMALIGASHEESVLLVSLQDCGCSFKQKYFNPLHPHGEYDLNMCLVRSRTILLVLMKLAYAQIGGFAPGITLCDRDPNTRKVLYSQYSIDVPSDISTWTMPDRGFLHFTFEPLGLLDAEEGIIHSEDRELEENLKRESSRRERLLLIQSHFASLAARGGSPQVPYRHAVWLLSVLGRSDGSDESRAMTFEAERVAVVVAAFDNVQVSKYKFQLLELLNAKERLSAEGQLGIMPFLFTPSNLTGYFRLSLSNVGEREIAIMLLERRGALKYLSEKRAKHVSGRKGGNRANVELIWRNAKVVTTNGFNTTSTDLTFEMIERYRIPCEGTLHIDFVDICKPLQQKKFQESGVMENQTFLVFLKNLRASKTAREKLVEIRKKSAEKYFTCLQVVALIELFDSDSSKERYSRVEVAVCMFSRTVDWRGFRHVVGHVGAALHGDVERRIGKINLYHDEISSPVGFWKLNLEIEDDLWIMQDLVHLAYFEPGNNMVDCTMDDCPFNIPRDWLVEVPRKHKVTLFYSRTREVAEQYRSGRSWDGTFVDTISSLAESFPPFFEVPTIDENDAPKGLFNMKRGSLSQTASIWTWMDVEKIRDVADVLRKHCKRAIGMFDLIDADGGGLISPAEFSQGLFKIGVWLPPSQLRLLFFVIDFNGDGDLSRHEFCQFWQQAPPLRIGDKEQREYWSIRGLPIGLHEKMESYYDVRKSYLPETVRTYGMEEPHYTLIPERSLVVRTEYDSVTQRLVVVVNNEKDPSASPDAQPHRILSLLSRKKSTSPRFRGSQSKSPERPRRFTGELLSRSKSAAEADF